MAAVIAQLVAKNGLDVELILRHAVLQRALEMKRHLIDAVLRDQARAPRRLGTIPVTIYLIHIKERSLALLWQIYSCRRPLQIHFRQCGHRCGGSRAQSSTIEWRTAGNVG